MRKPIAESTEDLVSVLKSLSPQRRDRLARAVLKMSRSEKTASGDLVDFERFAIAVDALCFSIDGNTQL